LAGRPQTGPPDEPSASAAPHPTASTHFDRFGSPQIRSLPHFPSRRMFAPTGTYLPTAHCPLPTPHSPLAGLRVYVTGKHIMPSGIPCLPDALAHPHPSRAAQQVDLARRHDSCRQSHFAEFGSSLLPPFEPAPRQIQVQVQVHTQVQVAIQVQVQVSGMAVSDEFGRMWD
jgi:hypothetical protein